MLKFQVTTQAEYHKRFHTPNEKNDNEKTMPNADPVSGFGGSCSSCANFIRRIEGVLADLQEDLDNH
jgi:hypothetical protein